MLTSQVRPERDRQTRLKISSPRIRGW